MLQQQVRVALLPLLLLAAAVLAALVVASPLYLPVISLAFVIVGIFSLLGYFRPYIGLVIWLCCVPWLSLAKWTGAMVIEEFDLALWGYALGVVLHLIRYGLPGPQVNLSLPPVVLVMVLLAISWQVWAIIKGYQLLPPNEALYFTNYEDQGGPLRIGKGLFSALCFYFCCRYLSADWPRFQRAFIFGFAFGALAVMLGCLFERWHFTGLLNLTTDYRTTAWFWEMHTGGATLDAYLALSLPFIMLGVMQAKNQAERLLLVLLLCLFAYVALTTFSRGVYLAVAIVGSLFILIQYLKLKAAGQNLLPKNKQRIFAMLAVAMLAIAAGLSLFPYGGYRVLLAISGLVLLLFTFVARSEAFNRYIAASGIAVACLVAVALYWLTGVAKPVYALYAICWFAAAALLLLKFQRGSSKHLDVSLAFCFMALALLSIAICWYWSDYRLTSAQLLGLLLVPLVVTVMFMPFTHAEKMPMAFGFAMWAFVSVLLLILVMFFNSSYIDSRFSTTDKDLQGRFQHWDEAMLAMPEKNDIWFGSGVGRFVPLNRALGDTDDQVAILSLLPLQQGNALYLKSGSHIHGYGEVFRITQQIARPVGDIVLEVRLRHNSNIKLLAEVCDKHLLYHGKCTRGSLTVKGASDGVGQYSIPFKDNPFSSAFTDNVMSKTFSLAISNPDTEIVLESLQLQDRKQHNLLSNSNFSEQMRYWFFSSDRHHMPYHVKGLWPMQLFEMGLIGLFLWSSLTVMLLLQQWFNKTQFSAIGNTAAMALLGLLLVGLFDSVIYGGRMAMLYFMLILLSGSIQAKRSL
uniref:COGs COG0697 n=1 Tax=Rheinheimera sp. BAL341 TaxID=1708203 RepID=A0A486XSS6_9GAMM